MWLLSGVFAVVDMAVEDTAVVDKAVAADTELGPVDMEPGLLGTAAAVAGTAAVAVDTAAVVVVGTEAKLISLKGTLQVQKHRNSNMCSNA